MCHAFILKRSPSLPVDGVSLNFKPDVSSVNKHVWGSMCETFIL